MNREFLKDLGLEKEAIDKIMAENGKDIEKAKGDNASQSDKIKELETENKSLKENLSERDKQLEELKKVSGDNDDLKKKIEQLKADNKAAGEKHEAELLAIRKSHAIEKALGEAKAKDSSIVRKLIDESKVSVDGGNLIGLTEQIEALKTSETTKSLFEEKQTIELKGAKPGQSGDPEPSGGELSEIDKRIAKYK